MYQIGFEYRDTNRIVYSQYCIVTKAYRPSPNDDTELLEYTVD